MNEEITTQRDEDDPIGEVSLPGRPRFGARAMALTGSSIGLGVAAAVGAAVEWTPTTPPLFSQF